MKKVLEGELLSIAHRVLQMKEKDINKLYKEAKELYEKLLILKFYQDSAAIGQTTDITEEELQGKLQAFYAKDKNQEELERKQMPEDLIEEKHPLVLDQDTIHSQSESAVSLPETVNKIQPEIEATNEKAPESINYDTDFIKEPYEAEEDEADAILHKYLDEHEAMIQESVQKESENTVSESQLVLEDEKNKFQSVDKQEGNTEQKTVREHDPFYGFNFGDVEFIRVEDVEEVEVKKLETEFIVKEELEEKTQPEIESEIATPTEDKEEQNQNTLFNLENIEPKPVKTKSINDIYNATIAVGLNDRIAFEKHLFGGSGEDFNRVLSQLNTVSSLDEAKSLIEHLVKPEYNNWEGKEEYEERFLALIENKFA